MPKEQKAIEQSTHARFSFGSALDVFLEPFNLYLFNFWSGSFFVKMSGLPDVDVDRMISSVQSKPVLWDKTSEKYKDKFKTQEAWKEVYEEISKDYGELDDTKKIEFGKY